MNLPPPGAVRPSQPESKMTPADAQAFDSEMAAAFASLSQRLRTLENAKARADVDAERCAEEHQRNIDLAQAEYGTSDRASLEAILKDAADTAFRMRDAAEATVSQLEQRYREALAAASPSSGA
jgi:hypothetical protein